MKGIWFIARKDAAIMLGSREALLWIFFMPVVFFYFIGTVTSGLGGDGGPAGDPIGVLVEPNAGVLADLLIDRLESEGFAVTRLDPGDDGIAEPAATLASFNRQLIIPAGFTETALGGSGAEIRFARKGGGLTADFDTFRLNRAVYSQWADVLLSLRDGASSDAELQTLAATERPLQVVIESAGALPDPPNGFAQAIPGTTVMFLLLVMLTSGAVQLVVERDQGLLRRLASAPLSRLQVFWGKLGGRLIVGVVQLAFAMLLGRFAFGLRWGNDVFAVVVVLVVYAALCAAIGLTVGTVARTEGQAVGLGVLATNLLAALGGCWWPIEVAPAWAQSLALFLPTGLAMDAMHKLISFGQPASAVLPHVAILAVATVTLAAITARRFRFL